MSEPWVCREVIGDAVMYLGDARAILPTLPDRSIDFVFTDPPYGHHNNNGDLIHRWESALGRGQHGEARAIENDGIEANELVQWSFAQFARLLARGGCCCCCCDGGGGPDPQFARWSLWLDEHLAFKQMVVWDKGPMGMGWHYRRSYETILVGEKRGGTCRWFASTNDIENIIRPGRYGIRKIIPQEDDHPTAKPVALPAHFIRLHTKPDDLVLDPFMGHAPAGAAAIGHGRRFIGIELDPTHFDRACVNVEAARNHLFDVPKPKTEQLSWLEGA